MSESTRGRAWVPGTLGLLLVVFLVFFLRSKLPVEQWLGPVRDWIDQFGASGSIVLCLGIVLGTSLGLPGSISAIVAGLALGMAEGMLVAWIGISAGSSLCFLLSRWIFGQHVNQFVSARPRLTAIRGAVQRRGWTVLLMLRLTPLVPLVVTNYLAGVSGVRMIHAALATAIGILPATMVYVGLGAAGASEPRSSAILIGLGMVAMVGLGIVARRVLGEVVTA
ncbi:MAG: TVP38/TMEM64 family protein [Verrucomicrobiales bacterium]